MPTDAVPDRNLSILWCDLCSGTDLMGLFRRFCPRWETGRELLLQSVQIQIQTLMLSQSDTGHTEFVPICFRVGDCRGICVDVWITYWSMRSHGAHVANHVLCHLLQRSLALPSMQAPKVSNV